MASEVSREEFVLTEKDIEFFQDNIIMSPTDAFVGYIGNDYHKINMFLREPLPSKRTRLIMQSIWGLDTFFLKLSKKSSSEKIVYRGIKYKIPPEGITEHGYMSTTRNLGIARTFIRDECCVYKLYVSAGIPFINVPEHYDSLITRSEEEILLPRGLRVIPIGIETMMHHSVPVNILTARVIQENIFIPPKMFGDAYKIQQFSAGQIADLPERYYAMQFINLINLLEYPLILEKVLRGGAYAGFNDNAPLATAVAKNLDESIDILLSYDADINEAFNTYRDFMEKQDIPLNTDTVERFKQLGAEI